MKIKPSRIMIVLFILCIIAGVIVYFITQNPKTPKEQNGEITYETINMLTNLRLGISEFDTIHPYATKNREVIYISSLIFEPLLTITQDYKIANCLAKECSKVGNKSYIIKLKENNKWSDNTQVTAQDVTFSIKELQQNETSIYYENVKLIEKAEEVDNTTVRIELKQEVPFFEYHLIFPIISKKQYEGKEIKDNKIIPLGTGKYKISKMEDKKIELTQNEFWREIENSKPHIKTITIALYETMGEVYNSFKIGGTDFMHTANPNVEEYIGSMGYGQKIYSNREYDYLALNCKDSILENLEVRKAIDLAINQEKIVASVLENKAMAAYFPIEDTNYLLKDQKIVKQASNEKAKETLEEAGWKYEYGIWQKKIGGRTKTLNITLSVSKEDEKRMKVAQEIKKQLEEVGIKIEMKELSKSQYERCLQNKQYEMLLTGVYTSLSPDLISFFGKENLANYENQEMLTILEEINHITNEELLKEKYKSILEIYQKEIPYIGLYRNQDMVVYNSSFRGEVTPNNYNIYYQFSDWYRQEE